MVHKKIILGVAVLIVAVLFWFLVKRWIGDPAISVDSWSVWVWPLATMTVLAGLMSLAFMLVSDKIFGAMTVLAVGGAYLIVFGLGKFVVASIAVMFLLHMLAARYVAQEIKERHKINIGLTIRRGLGPIVLAFLLVISFSYYQSPAARQFGTQNRVLAFVEQTVRQVLPLIISSQTEQLPAEQRQLAERQLASMQKQLVSEVVAMIGSMLEPFYQFIPPLVALGLFLLLQGFSFIFKMIAVWLAVGLFALMKLSGFVKVEEYETKAERIVL